MRRALAKGYEVHGIVRRVDARYYRPTEVDHLLGDASKAAAAMGWRPRTGFAELVGLMVDADVALLEDELAGRTVRIDRP